MIKKLYLQGTAREIGVEHGRHGREEVINSLETYERLFYGFKGISWAEAKEQSLLHLKAIETYDVEMVEEMEGIAKGAGVDFEDILALNARSEIALTGTGERFSDGCTTMAVFNPIIKDTFIAQNWDWQPTQSNSLLMLQIESKDKPTILMITEGGMIGKIGFNSAGVGICFNALLTNEKSDQVPIHLGLRAVLNSFSQTEALSKLSNGQIASSASFLIGYDEGNRDGMAVNVEVSPYGIYYVGDDVGKLAHTNHICSDFLSQKIEDVNEYRFEDSIPRLNRAKQLIDQSIVTNKQIDEHFFIKCLSDTFNAPNSINHYENDQLPEYRRMETVFSIIMNLSQRNALLRLGTDGEYKKIKIDG